MISRADTLIDSLKKKEIYSDFSTSFSSHPVTGRLLRLTNEDSVRQAIRNRILTIFGERLYQPEIGSNVLKSLFEFNDAFLKEDLKNSIKNSLQNDQRVEILDTEIDINDNRVVINVTVSLINNPTPILVSVLVRKIR